MTYRLADDIMYTLDIKETSMRKTKIDKLGRIVIPISYRKVLNINEETELVLDLKENQVVITPSMSVCRLCNKPLERKGALPVCDVCISKIKSLNM